MKSISGKRVCRILESHGWTLKRIRGSHHTYSKPGKDDIITVPVKGNRDLRKGTFGAILKAADLTENDF